MPTLALAALHPGDLPWLVEVWQERWQAWRRAASPRSASWSTCRPWPRRTSLLPRFPSSRRRPWRRPSLALALTDHRSRPWLVECGKREGHKDIVVGSPPRTAHRDRARSVGWIAGLDARCVSFYRAIFYLLHSLSPRRRAAHHAALGRRPLQAPTRPVAHAQPASCQRRPRSPPPDELGISVDEHGRDRGAPEHGGGRRTRTAGGAAPHGCRAAQGGWALDGRAARRA